MGAFLSGLFGGGGPSQQQQDISAKQTSLSNELMQDYSQLYAQQQDTFGMLKNAYSPIVAAGPNQHGFNSAVLNALNTQLINSNAGGYAQAAQAARSFGAGLGGGGTSGLTSGIDKQIQSAIASRSASNLATGETGVTLQDYATGRQNWQTALGGLQNLGAMQSPNAAASGAGSELSSAFGSASKIQDMKNAQQAAMFGGIASLGIDAVTGGLGAIGSGESFLGGLKDFGSGMLGGTGSAPGQAGY